MRRPGADTAPAGSAPTAARCLVVLSLLVGAAWGCTSDDRSVTGAGTAASPRWVGVARFDASEPVALAVGPDGALYVGERRSGRVLRVPPDQLRTARPHPEEIARLAVATEGQQGLLGLAVTADGWLLAGLTSPADDTGPARQEVVRLPVGAGAGPVQVVWRGPVAADLAIGGRIVLRPDGRVALALGDFGQGRHDPPYGSVVSLDPAGPPDQEPVVLSTGWNNPFGLATAPDGTLWVADNAPGSTPERLGRGDAPGPRDDLTGVWAPSGLVALGAGRFGLCGYVSGTLTELRVGSDGVRADAAPLGPCRLGVVALGDGSVAVAGLAGVTILRPR